MIATHYRKRTSGVWKNSLFNIFYPSSIYANRNFMFALARDCTCMATNAGSIIYYETKLADGILF